MEGGSVIMLVVSFVSFEELLLLPSSSIRFAMAALRLRLRSFYNVAMQNF